MKLKTNWQSSRNKVIKYWLLDVYLSDYNVIVDRLTDFFTEAGFNNPAQLAVEVMSDRGRCFQDLVDSADRIAAREIKKDKRNENHTYNR